MCAVKGQAPVVSLPKYPGLNGGEAAREWASKLGEFLQQGNRWPWEEAQALVRDATSLLKQEKTLERVEVPAGGHLNVVGDVHGQFFDLLTIWEELGLPSTSNPFLFNGDFVDRGSYSLETLLLLVAWKVALPRHVRLARGNHEAHEMNVPYGFAGEVLTKYGVEAYLEFQELFNYLPLAHVVNNDVLVVHGGLPRKISTTLDEIESLDRYALSEQRNTSAGSGEAADLFTDLLWADPRPRPGLGSSQRGGGLVTFGPDVTESFLNANKLGLLIRSHEVKDEGFEWAHGNRCLTVFSAPQYCDSCTNKGAVIKLKAPETAGPMQTEVHVFKACERPSIYVPAMVYSPMTRESRMFLSPGAMNALNQLMGR